MKLCAAILTLIFLLPGFQSFAAGSSSSFASFYESVRGKAYLQDFVESLDLPEKQKSLIRKELPSAKWKNAPAPSIEYNAKYDALIIKQAGKNIVITQPSVRPLSLKINHQILLLEDIKTHAELKSLLLKELGGSFPSAEQTLFSLVLPKSHAQMTNMFTPQVMLVLLGIGGFALWNSTRMTDTNKRLAEDRQELAKVRRQVREAKRDISAIQSSLGGDLELLEVQCSGYLQSLTFSRKPDETFQYLFSGAEDLTSVSSTTKLGTCKWNVLPPRLVGPTCNNGKTYSATESLPGNSILKNLSTCCKNETCKIQLDSQIKIANGLSSPPAAAPKSPSGSLRPAVTY